MRTRRLGLGQMDRFLTDISMVIEATEFVLNASQSESSSKGEKKKRGRTGGLREAQLELAEQLCRILADSGHPPSLPKERFSPGAGTHYTLLLRLALHGMSARETGESGFDYNSIALMGLKRFRSSKRAFAEPVGTRKTAN